MLHIYMFAPASLPNNWINFDETWYTDSSLTNLKYCRGNRKLCYPRPAEASGVLNDSHCNSSSTEAGVLVAYHQATDQLLSKEVRTITGGR
ncbi:hypothetical protein AVEN_243634-1 [Araneus ventricosus]|uniref:Uncharacterized protein n=1 Tax=Araneus ventricosus TaxID=182803 RepID=A0A4Y2A4I5_ARAVE|nr:hypothetical protein AVEN_243634-1 [Araneus ventricosus]